jgi:hypothetical protein
MRLGQGLHLAYSTNVHRGESWDETFASLRDHTLRVKDRVCPGGQAYAIGLRLSAAAAQGLAAGKTLDNFRRWLGENDCYIFTINGFPYGKFHGSRVKEDVYRPDWTTFERERYTCQLFDLLAGLIPPGTEGSISTLPGTFKEFVTDDRVQGEAIIERLGNVCAHVEMLREHTGCDLHLGVEPEPLGWFETTAETLAFFERFRQRWGDRFDQVLGVNYDTCHLAVEFESPAEALGSLAAAGVRVSKLHLSSALALTPGPEALERLGDFAEDVYLHQVVVAENGVPCARFRDLPEALAAGASGDEWRVHFHVPVHAGPAGAFRDTRDHLLGALDVLARSPGLCRHLELETYTWEVLPADLRSGDVVDQLVGEYRWALAELDRRGLAGS